MPKLSDNLVGDRLHAALEVLGRNEGKAIRGDTALVAARQTLALFERGLQKSGPWISPRPSYTHLLTSARRIWYCRRSNRRCQS